MGLLVRDDRRRLDSGRGFGLRQVWLVSLAVVSACGGDDGPTDGVEADVADVVADGPDGDEAEREDARLSDDAVDAEAPDGDGGGEDGVDADSDAGDPEGDDATADDVGEEDRLADDVLGEGRDGESEVPSDVAPEDSAPDDAGPGPECGNGSVDPGEECDADPPRDCSTACGSSGTQACVACVWEPGCAPPSEVCNGLDDDCLLGPDDGFACILGRTRSCTTSCASTGRQACGTDCGWETDCPPPAESCNGRDDDCDTLVDNGLECVPGESRSCVLGGCTGTQACDTACRWTPCDTGPAPANDTCAGVLDLEVGTTITGTTCGAHADYFGTCGGTGGPDVVFRLTLTAATFLSIDTAGTGYDTVLHVHGTCASWDIMTCNDDYGGDETARIDAAFAARTYYLMLDGNSDADRGPYTLSVTAP